MHVGKDYVLKKTPVLIFICHFASLGKTRGNTHDAAFKLKVIDLALREASRATARKLVINELAERGGLSPCKKMTKDLRGHKSRWKTLARCSHHDQLKVKAKEKLLNFGQFQTRLKLKKIFCVSSFSVNISCYNMKTCGLSSGVLNRPKLMLAIYSKLVSISHPLPPPHQSTEHKFLFVLGRFLDALHVFAVISCPAILRAE